VSASKTNQPCPAELTLSGFTSLTIPCDMPTRHRLPHRAEVRDEVTNKVVVITWRNLREIHQLEK
jgi:hypothetical protein